MVELLRQSGASFQIGGVPVGRRGHGRHEPPARLLDRLFRVEEALAAWDRWVAAGRPPEFPQPALSREALRAVRFTLYADLGVVPPAD